MNRLIFLIPLLTVLISCNQGNDNNINSENSIDSVGLNSINHKNPTKTTEIISPDIKMLRYLNTHFEQNNDSIFLTKPDWMIGDNNKDSICGFLISFKEGHTFKHKQECVEWGEIITVNFYKVKKDYVRQIVENLFENENYYWYENKTEYRPKESYEAV